jgi:hypothetical protein
MGIELDMLTAEQVNLPNDFNLGYKSVRSKDAGSGISRVVEILPEAIVAG